MVSMFTFMVSVLFMCTSEPCSDGEGACSSVVYEAFEWCLTVGPGNAASSDGSHYPGFWMWDSGWREKSPAPDTKKRFVLHTLGTQTLPYNATLLRRI